MNSYEVEQIINRIKRMESKSSDYKQGLEDVCKYLEKELQNKTIIEWNKGLPAYGSEVYVEYFIKGSQVLCHSIAMFYDVEEVTEDDYSEGYFLIDNEKFAPKDIVAWCYAPKFE